MRVKGVEILMFNGSKIDGKLNVYDLDRLSDYFKSKTDRFYTIFDAKVDGVEEKVIFVNPDYVIWAKPSDPEDIKMLRGLISKK